MVFDARPPFEVVKSIETGPITNHVNFARTPKGTFAYVTVGGQNEVKVFRTDNYEHVSTIPTGKLPHGVWPSGDGRRIYVGLENADALAVIDTDRNEVVATVPIGQAPQGIVYVPNAVPEGAGKQGLHPLAIAGQAVHLELAPITSSTVVDPARKATTSVSLFDQGLTQVLQASVAGLQARSPYVLALASNPDGSGHLEPLSVFATNSTGSAIVNATGPIRQIVQGTGTDPRRYLAILPGTINEMAAPVQIQIEPR
jgi:YVTN family beta-propeller protein